MAIDYNAIGYQRVLESILSSDNVANGDYTLELYEHGPRTNVVDYFYFVDGNGDQVDATAGTVTITISSGADIFQVIENGTFNADQARSATRLKPKGFGRADKARVNLAGITGANGFRMLISQSVS